MNIRLQVININKGTQMYIIWSEEMANIFDYITWRGDLSFAQSPFNEVDNLILSRLSYFPMDGIMSESFTDTIPLSHAVDTFFSNQQLMKHAHIVQKEDIPLAKAMADTNRFGHLHLCGYVNHIDYDMQKQFSCLTIILDETASFLSYRGTDATLVGWKEDFNMSFMSVIPAQQAAINYFESAAEVLDGKFYLGGHSKGGNLAVYASVFCADRLKPRIISAFNNDGPGVQDIVLESEQYKGIRERIHTYVPQSSVIGMLLEHEENYIVVQSLQHGLLQHDLFTWDIIGTNFVHLDTVNSGSQFLNRTLKEWIANLTLEERARFFNALYNAISSTNARTFQELDANWLKNAQVVVDTYSKFDKPTKQFIDEALKSLMHIGGRNIFLSKRREKG